MERLPPLVQGSASWHLPLSEEAAGRMLAAVLAEPRTARIRCWTDLLRHEPTIVLWAVCRGDHWRHDPPAGVNAVAAWFADAAPRVLQWPEPVAPRAEPPPESRVDWTAKARESVAAARCAAHVAGESDDGAAYLRGLLETASDWLSLSGPSPRSIREAVWPAWLIPGSRTDRSDWQPAWEAAVAACRDWTPRTPRSEFLLPAVMRRLGRLHQLEHEFEKTLENEKLAALKELAYGASHEINNPLANISTRAQTLMREETDPDRRRKLAVINAQAFRAHEMIADMMLFARPPALKKEPVELEQLADQVLEELAAEAIAQGTRLERIPSDAPHTIPADPEQLAVALKAVCTNALESLGSGGWVQVSIGPAAADAMATGQTRGAQILIRDNGPGIPPPVRRHLFDPYFSGREAGRGLGLGLAKCWRIVTDHGGEVQVDSDTAGGTTFRLRLPSAPD